MSKNVIIAIVVIVIIIAGIVWYMNQAATDVVDDGSEVVDTGDNGTGSLTTGDDTSDADGDVNAGADVELE